MTPPIPDRIHSAAIKEALNLARYEAWLNGDVRALLNKLGKELAADILDANLITPRLDWRQARLRELLKLTETKIKESYGQIDNLTASEYAGLVEVSAERIVVATNEAIGAKLLQPLNWTPEQMQALAGKTLIEGAPSAEWWSRQEAGLSEAFADQMRLGMMRGESVGDLVARVRDLEGIASNNAERLVRTSAISVNNAAHMAAYDANSDVIEGVSWSSTLDQRTCLACGALDGKSWKLGESHPVPSLHWNCRCAVIPKLKSWEQLAKEAGGDTAMAKEMDKIPAGDRASMNGPVSGSTTYQTWLDSQPEKVQREVLGTKKFEIYQRGNLRLKDLVDQRGNTLTLAELRTM